MSLDVDVRHTLGAFALDASFATDGALTALFGRSGSGKTTLVNLIGGLLRPDSGRIAVGDRVLVDTRRGIFIPAHRRQVGYVFQEARLFPHLSVRNNLLYGHWFRPRAQRYARIGDVIELLGLAALLQRRPDSLSGGEKQRVAIGRALLASPQLLLMDEPLASLDEQRKAEILPYIERLRDELRIPVVYVSHSAAEVARLATTVVVMADGKVVAVGPTAQVLGRPELFPYTGGDDAGGVLDAVIADHDDEFALSTLSSTAGELHVGRMDLVVGTRVRVYIRARDVMLAKEYPKAISAQNILRGKVLELRAGEDHGMNVTLDCRGETLVASITRRAAEAMALRPGSEVYAIVKSVAIERGGLGTAAKDAVTGMG
jgi:molybdate transport system ATP-binding protein